MTNGWIDIKNTDMMLIMGGNPAENHPCGFKWAMEAKRDRNAKMISVDPRFTRTSSTADLFLQIRAGSDIAFLGGLIRYAIENNRIAKEYLVNYTNAAFIVKEGFKLPEDGLYSGFNSASGSYDKTTWNYEGGGDLSGKPDAGAASGHAPEPAPGNAGGPAAPPSLPPNVAYDLTLQHPRCVFQLLKKQYSRYTPETVERITGIPKDQYLKAIDMFTSVRKDGDMKKVATIIYAVGWTQHTFGTQIIRTAAMIQLLLGNVGRAGGGVNALRGHSNIQGATDMAGLFDSLPGYLKVPTPADADLTSYPEAHHPNGVETRAVEFVELLLEHPGIFRVAHEGDVWRRGNQGKRICVRLPAETGPRLLLDPHLGRYVQRQGQGHVGLWHERRDDRPRHQQEHQRAEEGGLAGGRRNLSG